jgi:hypothetical protein
LIKIRAEDAPPGLTIDFDIVKMVDDIPDVQIVALLQELDIPIKPERAAEAEALLHKTRKKGNNKK